MADRKLKATLELDTSEARRKLRRDLSMSTSGSGSSDSASRVDKSLEKVATSADKAAAAADKAAASTEKTAAANGKAAASADKTASQFDQSLKSVSKAALGFAGLAVGLAASYAANYVEDPNLSLGVKYAGNTLAGASTGLSVGRFLGPKGMVLGAIAGAGAGAAKTYFENKGENSAMSKDFEQAEAIYADMRQKNKQFKKLSSTKTGVDIASNLSTARKLIEDYTKETASLVEKVRNELKKTAPKRELIAKLRREIDTNRGEIRRYEALVEHLDEMNKKPRESMAALDSLTKIGGIAASPAAAIAEAAEAVTGSTGGGSFGFSVPTTPTGTMEFSARSEGLMSDFEATMKVANERIEKIDADQLRVLTEIKDALKGQGGTATWQ